MHICFVLHTFLLCFGCWYEYCFSVLLRASVLCTLNTWTWAGFCSVDAIILADSSVGNRHLLEVCMCVWWLGRGCLYVHLGLSSRPELISVMGEQGGGRGHSGQVWVAGHLSRWYLQIHVFGCVFREWGSVWRKIGCWLGLVRFNRKLKCHKEVFISQR